MAMYNSFGEVADNKDFLEFILKEFGVSDVSKVSDIEQSALFNSFRVYKGDLSPEDFAKELAGINKEAATLFNYASIKDAGESARQDAKAFLGKETDDMRMPDPYVQAYLMTLKAELYTRNADPKDYSEALENLKQEISKRIAESAQTTESVEEEQQAEMPTEEKTQPETEQPVGENTTPKPEQPVGENTTPQPEEKIADKLEGMTSYDLLQYHKKLAEDYNKLASLGSSQFGAGFAFADTPEAKEFAERMAKIDGELKAVEEYAAKEIKEINLDENNAPLVKDYADILLGANPDYKYEKAAELEQKLADYDKNNGLDGKLPSPEKIKENEDKWAALTEKTPYTDSMPEELKKDPATVVFAKENPEIFKETLDVIRTTALTQLSLETPDSDKQKNIERYHQKVEEISAQYLATVTLTFNNIMSSPEDRNKWLDKYLKENKISADEWNDAQKDPEKKKEYMAKFAKYVAANTYTVANGIYTDKNAIYASRLGRKAGMKQTPERAAEAKKDMTAKHPTVMGAVKEGIKNVAWTAGLAAAFGPIGITARQGCKLFGAVKKSWRNYKEQNDGKTSIKGFFGYLKNNREETINLARQAGLFLTSAAFTTVMAASGTLAFGALGGLTGLGAQAAQTAAQTTIMGVGKAKVSGAITAAAGLGQYLNVRHEEAKAQKDLAALLQKYLPQPEEQGKGWFGIKKATPAQKIAKDISKLIRNGDDKVLAKLAHYAPNMSAEDKEQALELVGRIKGSKGKGLAAALGVAAGGFLMDDSAQDYVSEKAAGLKNYFFGEPENNGLAEGAQTGAAVGQGIAEPDNGGSDVITETPATHEFTITDEKVTDMPNATYVILKEMGLMEGKDFDDLRGSNTHIVKSGMTAYLGKLQLTDAQQAEFQAKLDSGEFDRIADKLNSGHMIIRPGGEVVERDHGWTRSSGGNGGHGSADGNEAGGNGGSAPIRGVDTPEGQPRIVPDPTKPSGFTEDAQRAIDEQKKMGNVTGKSESGSWFKRIFTKKHDHTVYMPVTADANATAEEYAGRVAMEEYNAKHPDNPITSAEEMKKHGYNVKGTVNGHKIHVRVSNDGNTETRTVDGVRMRLEHHNGVDVASYKGMNMASNTVGGDGGKEDQLLGRVRNQDGEMREYIRDGDSKDVYERDIDAKGNVTEVRASKLSTSRVKSILKNFGKHGNEM